MNYSSVDDQNQPVTVVVSQLVKTGQEKAFEEWLQGLSQEALKFEGHLGINIIRPPSSGNPEYVIIFRFDCYANLKQWIDSDIRQDWVEKSKPLVLQDKVNQQMVTGMEAWFTLPGKQTVKPPPRYKMTMILWLAVVVMINTVPLLLAPILKFLPPILRSIITSAIIVVLISYFILPFLTKLFSKWLYSSK